MDKKQHTPKMTGALAFSVPARFADEDIAEILTVNATHPERGRVIEVYGAMNPSWLQSGRSASVLPRVSRSQLRAYVTRLRNHGIDFNYVLNPSCISNRELSEPFQARFRDFASSLVDMGIRRVTCASHTLLPLISQVQGLRVAVSTISDLSQPTGLRYLSEFPAVDRICVPERFNRNLKVLRECVRLAAPIEVTTIVNNLCLLSCPFRTAHYNYYSHPHPDGPDPCIVACGLSRLRDPSLLIKSPWIRPEDIDLYAGVGIRLFKIAGRGLRHPRFGDMVMAYKMRVFDGDLVSMLYAFSPNEYWQLFSLPSGDVARIMPKILARPEGCSEYSCPRCGICDAWSKRVRAVRSERRKNAALREFREYAVSLPPVRGRRVKHQEGTG